MKKLIPILLVFNLLMAFCLPFGFNVSASGSTDSIVNVKLSAYLGNRSSIDLSITGKYKVVEDGLDLKGTYKLTVDEKGQLILYQNGAKVKNYGASFTVNPDDYNTQNVISINNRKYLGEMKFEVENGMYVRPYNTLPIEDYLKGVVSREMSPSWGDNGGMEALKAQAVAARTYALGAGSSIDDGQTDQVYTGYDWYNTTNQAIEATQGLVLKYDGKVIGANALYSSSNGGKILSKINSWGEASWNHVPYLQAKEDPYDILSSNLGNKNVDWSFSVTKNQIDLNGLDFSKPSMWWNEKKEISEDIPILTNMKNWLQNNGYVDKKYEIKIVSIPELTFDLNVPTNLTINGRITINYMLRDTTTNQYVMENGQIKTFSNTINNRAYTIRSIIGSTKMKSPYIKSVQDNGIKITVNGGGWGHGIGMSQYGAYQMSKEGKNFGEILGFYYPGTNIADVLGPTVSNLNLTVEDRMVTFSYTLDENSTTTITLINPQKNILSSTQQSKGNNQFTWDASFLSPGNYSFTISTKDMNGNIAQTMGVFNITDNYLMKLTLLEQTSLYSSPTSQSPELTIDPQIVKVIEQQGQWYKIRTWLGDKWIKPKFYSVPTEKSLKLTTKTNLYNNPSLSGQAITAIDPQQVNVIAEIPGTDWVQINTWLGSKWIKPGFYSVPIEKSLKLTTRTNLYDEPSTSGKIATTIDPQQVNVLAEISGTNWVQIKTWLGPKWVEVAITDEPEVPEEDNVAQTPIKNLKLYEQTNLYKSPTTNQSPDVTIDPQIVAVVEQQGEWFKIKTWLGDKWIKPGLYSVPTEKSLKVTTRTNLYDKPSTSGKIVATIDPQQVNVIGEIPGTDWILIRTWLGDKWIKPGFYSVPTEKSLKVTTRTNLYDEPSTSGKIVAAIDPQQVNVVAEIPGTNWVQIKTWLGPKWIEVVITEQLEQLVAQEQPVVPEIPEEDNSSDITLMKLTLNEKTNLYNSPSTDQSPDLTIDPQIVSVVEQQGEWYKIKTWLGDKWIKPGLLSIPAE